MSEALLWGEKKTQRVRDFFQTWESFLVFLFKSTALLFFVIFYLIYFYLIIWLYSMPFNWIYFHFISFVFILHFISFYCVFFILPYLFVTSRLLPGPFDGHGWAWWAGWRWARIRFVSGLRMGGVALSFKSCKLLFFHFLCPVRNFSVFFKQPLPVSVQMTCVLAVEKKWLV